VIKAHGSGDDRTGEASPAGLVGTADEISAERAIECDQAD
jgi:hypothetical protein